MSVARAYSSIKSSSIGPVSPQGGKVAHLSRLIVLDCFLGCGGNAIQFALAGLRVIACDVDAGRVALARQNARIYGVEHLIEFVVADCLQLMARC